MYCSFLLPNNLFSFSHPTLKFFFVCVGGEGEEERGGEALVGTSELEGDPWDFRDENRDHFLSAD